MLMVEVTAEEAAPPPLVSNTTKDMDRGEVFIFLDELEK
jgi:hypothetical protein